MGALAATEVEPKTQEHKVQTRPGPNRDGDCGGVSIFVREFSSHPEHNTMRGFCTVPGGRFLARCKTLMTRVVGDRSVKNVKYVF
jgi:hypothetical protein